jgi:hypothetical protein
VPWPDRFLGKDEIDADLIAKIKGDPVTLNDWLKAAAN